MDEERKPSYLGEMLSSQGNLYAALGAAAASALLSIPFGFGLGALPLLAFGAGEIIAAMYVPSLPTFRDRVDRRWRRREREATRQRLLAEIDARGRRTSAFQQTMNAYTRMASRVASLQGGAGEGRSRLAPRDIERLDDATVEYLYLWLASLVMDERAEAVRPADIEARIAALGREIASPRAGTDVRQLQKAREEYAAVLERHHRMTSRKRALEAAMLSMPDQLEEIYQTVMTTPLSEEFGARLEESIARLRLQEDIEAELSSDVAEAVPGMAAPPRLADPAAAERGPRLAAVAGARTKQSG